MAITNDERRAILLKGLPALPSPLRTERLDLLPITRAHAPAMFEVLKDESLYAFTGGSPPADVETLARLYAFWEQRRSPDGAELWLNWVMRLRDQAEWVGHLQAGVQPNHTSIAWTVGAKWQRVGYATEAATAVLAWLLDLGVRDIRASIHPAHAASIRVAERLGFHRTTESSGTELIWQKVG
jgi:RimJ/RimL family protein N-acetyltransferase